MGEGGGGVSFTRTGAGVAGSRGSRAGVGLAVKAVKGEEWMGGGGGLNVGLERGRRDLT